jgi:hypothetical protein
MFRKETDRFPAPPGVKLSSVIVPNILGTGKPDVGLHAVAYSRHFFRSGLGRW